MKKTLLILASGLSFFMQAQHTKQVARAMGAHSSLQINNSVAKTVQPLTNPQSISGYYQQGFEGTTFPPAGWQVVNVAGASYQWARSTAQAHSGTASAFMRYDATTGEDWLIAPHYYVSATTDSLTFWMRLAYAGYAPDSLSIKVSTTDSLTSSFTTTLLQLKEGTNYPSNSTTWYRYGVSLSAYLGQKIYFAFKHFNTDGDGLYVDDVKLGTPPAADVSAVSILAPSSIISAIATTPQVGVTNIGTAAQSFNITTTISPGGYSSTSAVTALAAGTSTTVTFASWLPTAGTYTVRSFTQLAGDQNTQNDTVSKVVTVLTNFQNYGWSSHTALPAGRWATSPVFTKDCISGTDTGFVYLISGGDAAFANSPLNTRYNTVTGAYTNRAAIPTAITQVTPLYVKGKIYVIGGYSGSFSPVSTNNIYDVVTDTWTVGPSLLTAVGDYAAGVYKDSLIYIVGGYDGSGDVNTVQIYDTYTGIWITGTVKPGSAVAGCRMGITGSKIVLTGGYSQTLANEIADSYIGDINPASPASITWNTLPAYPGGTSGRLGAGVALEANGLVYFAGGDPNGQGTSAMNAVYAYNTNTSLWEAGPNMPVGVSNLSGLTGAVYNDSLYIVTMGGYDGATVTSGNYWLNVGPAAPLPAAGSDIAICLNSTGNIGASNATGYAWSPSASLNNSTIANPVASPTTTTTYTVVMTKAYGCAITDSVKVTVNPLPVVTASALDTVLCSGDNTTLNGGGALTYTWSGGATNNVAFAPAATANYTVTGSDLNGCQNSDTITITVNALPTVALTLPQHALCTNNSAMGLSGETPSGGSWSGTAVSGSTFDPAVSGIGTFTVTYTYTDANGCTASAADTIAVSGCTGIASQANTAKVYPNPVDNELVIDLGANMGKSASAEFVNSLGETVAVFAISGSSQLINVSSLAKGVYVLRMTVNGSVSCQRIIKH